MRAVLDTNIVMSGIFWQGTPSKILEAAFGQKFRLILSLQIIQEYKRILQLMESKYPSVTAGSDILDKLIVGADIVSTTLLSKAVCSDPDDDKFLEAAIAGHAKYIASGDRALLKTNGYASINVIPATAFLSLL
jgi:putative PIN family toxin of toxin-antitoxin system